MLVLFKEPSIVPEGSTIAVQREDGKLWTCGTFAGQRDVNHNDSFENIADRDRVHHKKHT